jgi:hypothetical protein
MLRVLHNVGVLLFYPAVKEVEHIVFIQPKVFLEVLYKNVLHQSCLDNFGKIDLAILKNENELNLNKAQFIALLSYFDIIFQVDKNSTNYFAP